MSWYHLTRGREQEVSHDQGHVYSREGDIYKLTIQQLRHEELTNFTCRAENEVGSSRGNIEVTGKSRVLVKKCLFYKSLRNSPAPNYHQ